MHILKKSWWTETTESLARIDYRLFGTLLLFGLLPTAYITVRINFLGNIPDSWGYNIASQLTWLNVSYEVVFEALMLPMFYLIGKHIGDSKHFNNTVSNALVLTIALYLILSAITIFAARPMIVFMLQEAHTVDATVSYIRLETVAIMLSAIVRLFTIIFIVIKRERILLILLFVQLAASVLFDSLFISQLPISLEIGVNGIAFTNILVNIILIGISVVALRKASVRLFDRGFTIDFTWLKSWLRVGGLSGLENFVRNAAFILMVLRLVNAVQQQGNFWVTNNFIWGWLLLPVLALGELIRRETAAEPESIRLQARGWFALTTIIILIWIISIPFWDWFISRIMNVAAVDVIVRLSLISLGFYVVFAYNNVMDSVFYGAGRTDLMLYQSLIVNIVFYGSAFILYRRGVFTPDLTAIAIMFGLGIFLDSVITYFMYRRFVQVRNTGS
ncbi:MATE family Na+-driven efflux transporter [Salinispira pacifica]|uniref:Na+-driven multidrug efflux pump n=1 Tax=Salinispira pacifica TaxID=1307761 RepID=V5WER1_9SPIO|nr:MATE family Na+-driven efflux transporter [Salinispira pacifica]AHC14115.1 Na+-driven multidrug efflux pump [Salinispira pacifica]